MTHFNRFGAQVDAGRAIERLKETREELTYAFNTPAKRSIPEVQRVLDGIDSAIGAAEAARRRFAEPGKNELEDYLPVDAAKN